jgi:hypothetical protein
LPEYFDEDAMRYFKQFEEAWVRQAAPLAE